MIHMGWTCSTHEEKQYAKECQGNWHIHSKVKWRQIRDMENYIKIDRKRILDRLCSSGQSSWQQIQRSVFDSRRYQIFYEVVCLEWGPLSLVSKIEELLETNSIGSSPENLYYGRRRSAALTMWHSSIRKSWHQLRRQADVARSV
jgi:hypothetical protein